MSDMWVLRCHPFKRFVKPATLATLSFVLFCSPPWTQRTVVHFAYICFRHIFSIIFPARGCTVAPCTLLTNAEDHSHTHTYTHTRHVMLVVMLSRGHLAPLKAAQRLCPSLSLISPPEARRGTVWGIAICELARSCYPPLG